MNAPSVDVKDYLVSELGLKFGQDLFINREPPKPNNCLTIYDTGGAPDGLVLGNESRYEYNNIQVRARNSSFPEAWEALHLVRSLLHGKGPVTLNGTVYTVIRCMNGPINLGWDDNNRIILVMNFNLQRR